MDFQFWIWLIVIVITLIARANKKKPGQAPPSQDIPNGPRTARPSPQPKSITFEDLLREIQGEKALSRPMANKPKEPEPDFVDYDDDIPDEIESSEVVDYDSGRDEKALETYRAAQRLAASSPVLTESPKMDTLMRSEHFRGYAPKKKKVSFSFLNELKDPKGFKKAFIMSEILNKKY
ncbi:MAG: hypothetical protein KF860_06260 [Cyclobacteriaceae bacterium]|nr:hypothetical protein [Cyclobacteriaceae bacterium]